MFKELLTCFLLGLGILVAAGIGVVPILLFAYANGVLSKIGLVLFIIELILALGYFSGCLLSLFD